MSVWYLDLDDEITDAVARLRGATDDHVVLVIPPGSRIGTGRINFRLLAREAGSRSLRVSLVSGDAQVRALAVAAGLSSYASVMDAENASAAAEAAAAAGTAAPTAPATADGAAVVAVDALATTSTAPGPVAVGAATNPVARQSGIGGRFRGRGGRADGAGGQSYAMTPRAASAGSDSGWTDTGAVATAGAKTVNRSPHKVRNRAVKLSVAAFLLGGISYGAYQTLPTATVSLSAGLRTIGPQKVAISAQRDAQADPVKGTVPAEYVTMQLTASGNFPATDKTLSLSPATGTVVFTNKGNELAKFVPQGTIVSTPGGIDFVVQKDVILPKATDTPATTASVQVKARKGGSDGNVPAGSITVVPASLANQLITVTNPQPTTGGTEGKARKVGQDDFDTAVAALTTDLQNQLDAALADPTLPPVGHTVFPASQHLGTPLPDHTFAELSGPGGPAGSFDLTLTTNASVLAVDEQLVGETAGQALLAGVPSTTTVHPDTLKWDIGKGTVAGDKILFDVAVQAQGYAPPDPMEIKNAIKGKTVSEAQGILESYGTAQISVWPGFPATIPDDVGRITLHITEPEVPSQ